MFQLSIATIKYDAKYPIIYPCYELITLKDKSILFKFLDKTLFELVARLRDAECNKIQFSINEYVDNHFITIFQEDRTVPCMDAVFFDNLWIEFGWKVKEYFKTNE